MAIIIGGPRSNGRPSQGEHDPDPIRLVLKFQSSIAGVPAVLVYNETRSYLAHFVGVEAESLLAEFAPKEFKFFAEADVWLGIARPPKVIKRVEWEEW